MLESEVVNIGEPARDDLPNFFRDISDFNNDIFSSMLKGNPHLITGAIGKELGMHLSNAEELIQYVCSKCFI